MAKVGMNHLRSLGLRAGKKNASSCQMITGAQATTADHMDILKRTEKASKAPNTLSMTLPDPSVGMYCATG